MPALISETFSLTDLPSGQTAYFLSLDGIRTIAGRLTSLGFTPGVEILMDQNYGRGPLIVTVRGARVALGRREAAAIRVQRSRI